MQNEVSDLSREFEGQGVSSENHQDRGRGRTFNDNWRNNFRGNNYRANNNRNILKTSNLPR